MCFFITIGFAHLLNLFMCNFEEEIKKDIKTILNDEFPEEAIVILGENRGQLFARIPKIVTKRLKLKKGSKLFFKVYNDKNKKPQIEVKVDGN